MGKTSLARHILPKADLISFDLPQHVDSARLDPAHFFSSFKEPLILDEVQYAPELFRYLKVLIDSSPKPGRFLLTGSQDFSLMQKVSESLAGRCAVLTLPTLSLVEINPDANLSEADQFAWQSGFPALWAERDKDRELWLGSYLATYLERDVRNILNVSSLRDFDRFLRALAIRSGNLLSYSELARDLGIAPNTVKSWLSILQTSQQIFFLEPYPTNLGKRLIKTPKVYFADVGLLIFLLGFRGWRAVLESSQWGAIWENFVIAEVRKMFLNAGERPQLWFWRTSAGDEIDLLIDLGPQRFLAIECKTAAIIESRALKGFREFHKNYGAASIRKGAIICRSDQSYPLWEGGLISALPMAGPQGLFRWLEVHLKN
ncbi:MAG: ATP-binding protein [Planctomycetes bacterium]|nr:ATP-binding protein [Planctomycetota bacterium]